MDMSLSKFWEMVKDRETWHAAVHGVVKSRIQLSNWATKEYIFLSLFSDEEIEPQRVWVNFLRPHMDVWLMMLTNYLSHL